jgi:hypothetical protein
VVEGLGPSQNHGFAFGVSERFGQKTGLFDAQGIFFNVDTFFQFLDSFIHCTLLTSMGDSGSEDPASPSLRRGRPGFGSL